MQKACYSSASAMGMLFQYMRGAVLWALHKFMMIDVDYNCLILFQTAKKSAQILQHIYDGKSK